MQYRWPLMRSNFQPQDFREIVRLIAPTHPDGNWGLTWDLDVRLTQGEQVRAFEQEFSAWQGQRHAVFVNSGSSANLLTMAAIKARGVTGKVLVPCITWASDITSVLHAGFEPIFVDVDRQTLGMDGAALDRKLRQGAAAVFLTHCFGYDAYSETVWDALNTSKAWLFEDCCESIGGQYAQRHMRGFKLGAMGLASNFSFYYAHHMTTVEGGMVCTDDGEFADHVRCLRGHGLTREVSQQQKGISGDVHRDLDPEFVFQLEGYNCRSTEINAAIGRSQLKRLDEGIERRRELAKVFYQHLDPAKYETGYDHDTASPYGLVVQLKHADENLRDGVARLLREMGVETRRGVAGGGNQLRQPYLRRRYGTAYAQYPNAEHLHFFAYSIGLWPDLPREDVLRLAEGLNKL